MVKNPSAYAGDAGEAGLIPGSERTAGGGNGNPLQHSMDRGAWWAIVLGGHKSVIYLNGYK